MFQMYTYIDFQLTFLRNHLQVVSETSAKSSTDEDMLEKKPMG